MAANVPWALVGCSAIALAGCAGVQVQGVGTDSARSAYNLTGPDLGTLAVEATRLCPSGHQVLRQWQRYARPPGSDAVADSVQWSSVASAFSYDLPPPQAQMSIVCQS